MKLLEIVNPAPVWKKEKLSKERLYCQIRKGPDRQTEKKVMIWRQKKYKQAENWPKKIRRYSEL